MPLMSALGAFLLLGTLILLLNSQSGGMAQQTDASAATLQQARIALLVAREALSSGAPDSLDSLSQARSSLSGLNRQGLSDAQSRALSNLSTGLETLENNWQAREALAYADTELEMLLPQLDDAANGLEEVIVIQGKPIVVAQLERLRLLAEGLRENVQSLSTSSAMQADVTQQLLDREMAFAQIIRGFERGDPSLGLLAVADAESVSALAALTKSTSRVSENVQNVLAVTEGLAVLTAVGGQFNALDAALGLSSSSAPRPVNDTSSGVLDNIVLVLIATALLVFLIIAGLWYRQRDIRKAADLQTEQTEQNQAAIMRLLDELGSLADGDLTIKATVNEDITGAIADSINYAIEALRELVGTLNDSAIRVDGAARQTDQTAEQLAEATAEQSKQIEDASQAIHA